MCTWMLQQAEERRRELANQPTWTSQGTPIMWASWAGSLHIIDLLVVHGANVDHVNVRGETALHWAAAAGHVDACKHLALLGENDTDDKTVVGRLQKRDHSGRTPLDCARLYDRDDVVDWMIAMIFSNADVDESAVQV